jgi:hypothetical protein
MDNYSYEISKWKGCGWTKVQTGNWQTAIDEFNSAHSAYDSEIRVTVFGGSGIQQKILRNIYQIQEWSEHLMDQREKETKKEANRVERRIMEEMKQEKDTGNFGYAAYLEAEESEPIITDGTFPVAEIRFRDEISGLMGKVFGGEKPEDVESTAVNPDHYKEIVPGYQYFDVMDHMLKDWKGSQAHAFGNALKYQMRLGKKDDVVQEIEKAIWYLERLKQDVAKNGKL